MIHGIPEMIAARALNSIPAGLAIAALAWLGLKAFSKQGSGIRFGVWFVALLGIAAVPFVPSLRGTAEGTLAFHAGLTLPGMWANIIVVAWALVLAVIAVRLAIGLWSSWRLKHEAIPLAISDLPAEAQCVMNEHQDDRSVQICRSTRVRIPTAIGFFKPTVLLPDWVLSSVSDHDLAAVLLHELAHLRRRDDWTNLAQKLLSAVFFFHPAVWFVERRLELEREMACDELVLAKTGNRHAYAECLVSLAEKSFAQRGLAMAQSLIGHARSTAMRLTRILDRNQHSAPRPYGRAMAFASAAVVLCVVLAPGAPKFIAFQDQATPPNQSTPVIAKAMSETAAAAPAAAPTPAKIETSFRAPSSRPQVRVTKPAQARQGQSSEVLARKAVPDVPASRTQYVLVMQTQFDRYGEMRTQFSVWKLTVRDSDNRAIRAQVVMSSL